MINNMVPHAVYAPMQAIKKGPNSVIQDPHFQATFATRTIQLVAPSSGVNLADIKSLESIKILNLKVPDNLQSGVIPFHSNTDEERFLLLKNALYDNSENTVVWCLRGGYGSARLIDKLKELPKPKKEKVFIGYSDITALHLFLAQHWNWQTIHGSGLVEILLPNKAPENFQRIARIVSKSVTALQFRHLVPLNTVARKLKKVSGRLTGGNLSIVQTSIGTDWQINTTHKILFLEDIGAHGYQIDRALLQLMHAGMLKDVHAIILGSFIGDDKHISLALERFAFKMGIPVFKTDQFGHGNINYPLIYNAKAVIVPTDVAEDFTLTMYVK